MAIYRRTVLKALAAVGTFQLLTRKPLHAEEAPLAIKGYDPVAYFTDGKPVEGSPQYEAVWDNNRYRFASAEHLAQFKSDPAHYAPQFGGYCAYGTAEGHKAPTEPQAFTVVDDKLYLNYNDHVMQTWRTDIGGYIKKANANWDTVKEQPAP